MNYEKTDKIISEKYLSVEPDFDAEGVWNQLKPKIKRKRKRGFWLWFVTGILLIVFFSYYQMSIHDDIFDSKISEVLNDHNSAFLAEASDESINEKVAINKVLESKLSVNDQLLFSQDIYDSDKIVRNNIENNEELPSSELTHLEDNRINKVKDGILVGNGLPLDHKSNTIAVQNNYETSKRTTKSLELLSTMLKEIEYDRAISILLNYTAMPPIAPSFNKNKIRLGIFGGYYSHSRSLSHSGGGSNENYTSRVDEEKAIDAIDLGLKLDYFINDNLVVFGGLRYDQSFVERNADYVYLESITISDQTVLIIETENGTLEQTGDITFDGYYVHKANNYLTTKRMGVLAGVQYRIGNGKWKSFINLGVELPIWTSLSGIITNDGKPNNLSDGDLEISNRPPLLFGGVGGEYALSERIGLQVMIGGYLPTGNEYSESYNIIKKSTQLGVNLGIHFQL